MSRLVTSTDELSQVAVPNFPLAPAQYEQRFQDQLNNVLRLYLNQLNKIVSQLEAAGPYTVATLPSASTSGAGSRAFVNNALAPSFGATVVGGGTVAVPVYSDGTNWKVG
jgi:hypothetical protein